MAVRRIVDIIFIFTLLFIVIDCNDDPCADQHGKMLTCLIDLKKGEDAKLVIEKEAEIRRVCLPDYPKSCMDSNESTDECLRVAMKYMDTDRQAKEVMSKTASEINKCFETVLSDPLDGLSMLLESPVIPMRSQIKRDSRSSGMSEERSSGESKDSEKRLPFSMGAEIVDPECASSQQQVTCLRKERVKANSERAFANAVDTLSTKKEECEKKITRRCRLSTAELAACYWKAQESLVDLYYGQFDACMQQSKTSKGERKHEDGSDEILKVHMQPVNDGAVFNELVNATNNEKGNSTGIHQVPLRDNSASNSSESTSSESSEGKAKKGHKMKIFK